MSGEGIRIIDRNKKARHDYHIEETYEAGIVLQGTEVKSARQGKVSLKNSFALVRDNEVWLHNMHISKYDEGNRYNHIPERKRKLLLHKKQIRYLIGKTEQRGFTLIPLKIYFKRQLVKLELALAEGKNKHDKREALKKKAHKRDMERALKNRQVGKVDY